MISVRKPDGSRPSALLPFSISRRDNQIYDCCGLDNVGEAYLQVQRAEGTSRLHSMDFHWPPAGTTSRVSLFTSGFNEHLRYLGR
jgi:hypothetical protein